MNSRVVTLIILGAGAALSGQSDAAGEAFIMEKTCELPATEFTQWPRDLTEAQKITQTQVTAFLLQCEDLQLKVATDVRSFRFARMSRNAVHLIANINSYGTSGFSLIAIIECKERLCSVLLTGSEGENDLERLVVSASNDGISQLLVSSKVIPGTVSPGVYVYSLLAMSGGGLIDVTARYREFADTAILPLLRRQLRVSVGSDSSETERDPEADAEHKAAAEYALGEYHSRVAGVSDTMTEYAMSWATAPFERVQRLALRVAEETHEGTVAQKILALVGRSPYLQLREFAETIRRERDPGGTKRR